MKDNKEVIAEFNEYVNMTASELEKWLESDTSNGAGVPKDGGDGISVGQESGAKIVGILKSNPGKDPDNYIDEHLQHMRKVVSYCKRHLAQEAGRNKEKDAEDVKHTKSYISLKNWGHDFLKGEEQRSGSANGGQGKARTTKEREDAEDAEMEDSSQEDIQSGEEGQEAAEKKAGDKNKQNGSQLGKRNGNDNAQKQEGENDDEGQGGKAGSKDEKPGQGVEEQNDDGHGQKEERDEEGEAKKIDDESKKSGKQNGDDDAHEEKDKARVVDKKKEGQKTGGKRKNTGSQNGSNKKRKNATTEPSAGNESGNEDGSKDEGVNREDQDGDEEESEGGRSGDGKTSKKGPKKGQTVSWNWGNGNPQGKVLDVKEDKATITTKRGNKVSRDGDAEDPAVILDTGKSKAIKAAHELN